MTRERARRWGWHVFTALFVLATLPFTGPGYLLVGIAWIYRKLTGRKESRSSLHRPMSHDPGGF